MVSNIHVEPICELYGYGYAHLHANYEIILILSDNVEFSYENQTIVAEKGDLFVIPPYMFHKISSMNKFHYTFIWFDEHWLLEHAPTMKNLINYIYIKKIFHLRIPKEQISDITRLFIDAYDVFKSTNNLFYDFLLITSISKIIYNLVEIHIKYPQDIKQHINQTLISDKNKNLTYSIVKYITDNIDGNLSTEVITKKFAISKTTLYYILKKTIGMSLKQIIIQLKLSKASELLMHGISVTDTANMLGFESYSNFIKLFKKKTNISPYKYGKQFKQFMIDSETVQKNQKTFDSE